MREQEALVIEEVDLELEPEVTVEEKNAAMISRKVSMNALEGHFSRLSWGLELPSGYRTVRRWRALSGRTEPATGMIIQARDPADFP